MTLGGGRGKREGERGSKIEDGLPPDLLLHSYWKMPHLKF